MENFKNFVIAVMLLIIINAAESEGGSAQTASLSAREYFPCNPGYELVYNVTVENGNEWYAGKHWITFQDSPEDSAFSFILSTQTNVSGVGRYFKQGFPFYIQSMRNISGDSPRFFDFVTLKQQITDGDMYDGFNGFKYSVHIINDSVVIEFDSRNSKWNDMRGTGKMTLKKNIGIESLEFIAAEKSMFGPANCKLIYKLEKSKNVQKIKLTGKIIDASLNVLQNAAVAVGTYWLNPPSQDKPVAHVNSEGKFEFSVYSDPNTPIMLSYGTDSNTKWQFDGKYKIAKNDISAVKTGDIIEFGDLIY